MARGGGGGCACRREDSVCQTAVKQGEGELKGGRLHFVGLGGHEGAESERGVATLCFAESDRTRQHSLFVSGLTVTTPSPTKNETNTKHQR